MAPAERAERIFTTESAFRSVNDHIRLTAREWRLARSQYICECGNPSCDVKIDLEGEYDNVRAHPLRFIVAKGHVIPGVEAVIEDHTTYGVVEKFALPGQP